VTNVGICGASGKMGERLTRLLSEKKIPSLALAGSFNAHDKGCSSDMFKGIDVLIDFSSPNAFTTYAPLLSEFKKAAVIGTTGYTQEQLQNINNLATQVPIVMAPNMSVGVNVLFNIVEQMASQLPADFEIHVQDIHHKEKKDAPSGTALKIKDHLQKAHPGTTIPVDSVRTGDVTGEHTISFYNEGERLELTHRALSRDIFALGALRAARWVVTQKPGLYSMNDVLKGEL
jgi:4-hydroxy-tetrahydrodipicolinate reductase